MNKTFYIKTWGCQINEYDSSKIINLLETLGDYKQIIDYKIADLIVLNGCSIRQKSENKLLNFINKIEKNRVKKSILCVCGCVASQKGNELFLYNDIVNIICGPQSIYKLYYLILEYLRFKKKIIDIKSFNLEKNFFLNKNNNNENIRLSTYVPIMEGCNKFCSYCIVPFVRGREISRLPDNIIKEINYLSKYNINEINLLGQNVISYKSFWLNGKLCNFSSLLKKISYINNIKRIRFTTSHPIDFNDDIIYTYKVIPKIVNYLHLPVQSGSNKILKLMNRKYCIEYYKELINKILDVRPKMIFSTDFIIGFPGETEKDFLLTLDLIKELKFDHSYIFIYSPRPGTKSFLMKDNISLLEKKRRFYEVKKLINKNIIYWNKTFLNKKLIILVEGVSKKNSSYLFGRTENNRKVYFLYNSHSILGKLVKVRITKMEINYLYGNLIK